MNKALILHCWFGAASEHWYPWLKVDLEKKRYTAIAGEDMSKRLDATFMLVKGAGHFTKKDFGIQFPQLANIL